MLFFFIVLLLICVIKFNCAFFSKYTLTTQTDLKISSDCLRLRSTACYLFIHYFCMTHLNAIYFGAIFPSQVEGTGRTCNLRLLDIPVGTERGMGGVVYRICYCKRTHVCVVSLHPGNVGTAQHPHSASSKTLIPRGHTPPCGVPLLKH